MKTTRGGQLKILLLIIMDFKKLLEELKNTGIVKITGSYADGTQTEYSDVDFYIFPDKPDTQFLERRMLKIIVILNKHNIQWNSTRCGYISTIHSKNKGLPIELEFSDAFDKRKNKLNEVELFGINFKTH